MAYVCYVLNAKDNSCWTDTFKAITYFSVVIPNSTIELRGVKLRWLQMRILHIILATNITLTEMGVVDDTRCNFCNTERGSVENIFGKCHCIRRFF